MATNLKFSKFDNRPWGFRLAGGSDFPQPLTVIRVSEGSLAECMGLRVGDVVVRLNDKSISSLTHGQAHEALSLAGNNFVLSVLRVEDTETLVDALKKDDIEPYAISLNDLPPLQPLEEILSKLTAEPPIEEEQKEEEIIEQDFEEKIEIIEEVPQKPKDEDSEEVPNKNLTDEEIAQLILEEEELLPDKGVLGVNFKKLRPRAPLFKESKVFEELQKEATAEPPQVQELKRTTTFLQKPERPIPKSKSEQIEEKSAETQETYKVVIKKQCKKSITERLMEKGLLEPGCVKTPEPGSEKTTPAPTPDPCGGSDCGRDSRPESKAEVVEPEAAEVENQDQVEITEAANEEQEPHLEEPVEEDKQSEKPEEDSSLQDIPSLSQLDEQKLKELVTTEISLEKQLESVQKQLLALKQLPSEIENHLKIVSEQLYKIMELSGVRNGKDGDYCRCSKVEDESRTREEEERTKQQAEDPECLCVRELGSREGSQQRYSESDGRRSQASENDGVTLTTEPDEEPQSGELEISVKSNEDDENRVKKYIVSYESKVESMNRETSAPSPSPSQRPGSNVGNFEPDPNVDPKVQLIEELKHRQERKRSQDLWPQAKQLELTYGRRWRCPNDFFNDDMIAEVLSSQAEVIRGRTLGVNFKKFEKTALPNFDHLMGSSVYKMIHKMEQEPKKGIPARPPKVNAAEDIIERVNSPSLSAADDRSCRSISH